MAGQTVVVMLLAFVMVFGGAHQATATMGMPARKLLQIGGDKHLGDAVDNAAGYTIENVAGAITNKLHNGSGCNNGGIIATSDPCGGSGGAPGTKAAGKAPMGRRHLVQLNKIGAGLNGVGSALSGATGVEAAGLPATTLGGAANTLDGPGTDAVGQVFGASNSLPTSVVTGENGVDGAVNNVLSPALNNAANNQPKVFDAISGSSASGLRNSATKAGGKGPAGRH